MHTHSTWATVWAQAQRPIPLLGTTHADLSPHPIPLTRALTEDEIDAGYEAATGAALIEAVREHGPCRDAVRAGARARPVLLGRDRRGRGRERRDARGGGADGVFTTMLDPDCLPLAEAVRAKHYARKHGPHAYYGQP